MVRKVRVAKEKEHQENTMKRPQQNVSLFSMKPNVKLNISEFPVQKYVNNGNRTEWSPIRSVII